MGSGKRYTAEFKQGAVRMVLEEKRSVEDVARSLGVTGWSQNDFGHSTQRRRNRKRFELILISGGR